MDIRYTCLLLIGLTTAGLSFGSPCVTVSNGAFIDPSTWSCGCDPSSCDTLVIEHEVFGVGDLMITAHLLRISTSGAITGPGNIDIESDSLYNHGTITASGTLRLGDFNVTENYGIMEANYCNQRNILYNHGSVHFAAGFTSLALGNSGSIDGGGTFAVYLAFSNEVGGTIDTDSLFIFASNASTHGPIVTDSAFYVGNPFIGGELTLSSGAEIICRKDFYNYGTIDGSGPICVAGHSENHGALNGGIDFCDATPTVSEPPIIDVNDGTVWHGVDFCSSPVCPSTLSVGGQQALQSIQVVPNPANGPCHVLLPAGLVVASYDLIDAQGRTVRHTTFPSSGELLIEAPATAGVYSLVLRTQGGARVVRSVVFLP